VRPVEVTDSINADGGGGGGVGRGPSYPAAGKLLGGRDGTTVDVLERLTGGPAVQAPVAPREVR
jgi:hypothetical protein